MFMSVTYCTYTHLWHQIYSTVYQLLYLIISAHLFLNQPAAHEGASQLPRNCSLYNCNHGNTNVRIEGITPVMGITNKVQILGYKDNVQNIY